MKKDEVWDKFMEGVEKYLRETPEEVRVEIWRKVLEKTKDHHGPTLRELIKMNLAAQASMRDRT